MKIRNFAAAAATMTLAGCQAGGFTYTKVYEGPPLEYAQAQCNILAPGTNQGFVAWGSTEYVAGAALGNALGNAIREQQFIKNCMMLQGWRQDSAEVSRAKNSAMARARMGQTPPPVAAAKQARVGAQQQAAEVARLKKSDPKGKGRFPPAPKPYGAK